MADTLVIFAVLCGIAILGSWAVEKIHAGREDKWRGEYDNDWE